MAAPTALSVPELTLLSRPLTRRLGFSVLLARISLSRNRRSRSSGRIRCGSGDGDVAVEEREARVVSGAVKLGGGGNGYARGGGGENGSLGRYVNGNGARGGVGIGVETVESREVGRKKRIEEIGKEIAWFKEKTVKDQVEVSVAPGGRWGRFKTYSTIQRTLEIWGFVISFAFKAWLNDQKFAYRGGMTEVKKVAKRKALAKWLKESILRLGPTFIKIGLQFSTRVDILAQEYIDQLSELQVRFIGQD